MDKPQPQYHISDITWRRIQPHLPGQKGQWGGIARDNRLFIDAVLWVLRTGAPWRKLPEEYGKWGTVHHRFIRWRDKRLWEKLLEILIDDPDFAWLIVDTGPCGEHRGGAVFLPAPRQMKHHAATRYRWPWMRMVCQSEYLLQAMPQLLTSRQGKACRLPTGLPPGNVPALGTAGLSSGKCPRLRAGQHAPLPPPPRAQRSMS